MQLKDLPVGAQARVTGFNAGGGAYRRKLLALGLLPGTEFTVARIAPLGDPVEVRVRGLAVSLRRDEASVLTVEALP